jgi:hypothetical protein
MGVFEQRLEIAFSPFELLPDSFPFFRILVIAIETGRPGRRGAKENPVMNSTSMRYLLVSLLVVMAMGVVPPRRAEAQSMVKLTTPYHIINDSFYENFGLGWGTNRMGPNGGWYFNTGPANSTPPPFGGYDPAADARLGFRLGGFNFDFLAGTGSNRSHVMQAPSVVVSNGQPGWFFDGSMVPFVTGVVPVVGNAPMPGQMPIPAQSPITPLEERWQRLQHEQAALDGARGDVPAAGEPVQPPPADVDDDALVLGGARREDEAVGATRPVARASSSRSTADHGDISVAEIRAQQAAQDARQQQELQVRIEKAQSYEQTGQPALAVIYYKQAAARAQGEQKRRLLEKIASLND